MQCCHYTSSVGTSDVTGLHALRTYYIGTVRWSHVDTWDTIITDAAYWAATGAISCRAEFLFGIKRHSTGKSLLHITHPVPPYRRIYTRLPDLTILLIGPVLFPLPGTRLIKAYRLVAHSHFYSMGWGNSHSLPKGCYDGIMVWTSASPQSG
jgi:hypothetical protein